MPGPLDGLRVVELAGIGPAPHAAMVLGDLGADVVRVERPVAGFDLAGGQPDYTAPQPPVGGRRPEDRRRAAPGAAPGGPGPTCCWRGSGPGWPNGWASARSSVTR